MKKVIYIALLATLSINCKAQTRLVPIQDQTINILTGDYLIDIDGYLNDYVGVWNYTNGSTSLKFNLQKAINNNNGYYHEDLIYGEYQYVENGVEKINTLSQISTVYQAQANHNIDGNWLTNKNDRPVCNDCAESEKRLRVTIVDPLLNVAGTVYLRRINSNNQIQLVATFYFDGITVTGNINDDSYHTEFVGSTIPNGTYVLVKE